MQSLEGDEQLEYEKCVDLDTERHGENEKTKTRLLNS